MHDAKTDLLFNDEFSEIEVAVFVTFDIDFIPCDLCKMYSEKALSIESLVSVDKVNLAAEFCGNLAELNNVAVSNEFNLVKVLAASFHKVSPPLTFALYCERRSFSAHIIIIYLF